MVSAKHVRSVDQAVELGNLLIGHGVIVSATGNTQQAFLNAPLYYQFHHSWAMGLATKQYDPRLQETVSKRFVGSELITLSLGALQPQELYRQHFILSLFAIRPDGGNSNDNLSLSSSASTLPASFLRQSSIALINSNPKTQKDEIPLGHAVIGLEPSFDPQNSDDTNLSNQLRRTESAGWLQWRPSPWLAEGPVTLYGCSIGYFKAYVACSYS